MYSIAAVRPSPQVHATGTSVIGIRLVKVLDNGESRPLDLEVGDRVLLGKYSGTEVKLDGEEYLMTREDDIMGVVES